MTQVEKHRKVEFLQCYHPRNYLYILKPWRAWAHQLKHMVILTSIKTLSFILFLDVALEGSYYKSCVQNKQSFIKDFWLDWETM